jgi:hypothetical protein
VKQLIEKAEGLKGDAFTNRAVLHREHEDLTLEVIPVNVKGLMDGSVPDIAFIVETYQTATGCQKPLSQEIRKFPFTTGSGIKIQYIQK